MISLKKYLDELAGPDHPFVKGAPGRESSSKNEGGKDTKAVEEELIKTLNQFLRTNRN
jgi:hypothetical protein